MPLTPRTCSYTPNQMSATPAPTPEEILAELLPSLVGANTTRFVGIAAFTILLYDHFLTFDDEVRAIIFCRVTVRVTDGCLASIFLDSKLDDIASNVLHGEFNQYVH